MLTIALASASAHAKGTARGHPGAELPSRVGWLHVRGLPEVEHRPKAKLVRPEEVGQVVPRPADPARRARAGDQVRSVPARERTPAGPGAPARGDRTGERPILRDAPAGPVCRREGAVLG